MTTDTCESIVADPKLIALLRLEGEMRRDLDYMRQMLLDMEASDEWQHELGLDDDDDPVRDYHVILLRRRPSAISSYIRAIASR